MSLERSAISGIKWTGFSQIVQQIISIITIIILAHLLPPSNFGLIAITTVIIGFISLFRDIGMSAAIVQRKNVSEELLSSIFCLNMVLGVLGTIILYSFSPFIAIFFNEKYITPILKVLSFSFLISSLGILHLAILKRELRFKDITKINLSANIIGSSLAIGAALIGAGVWSLVFQIFITETMVTTFLWCFTGLKVRLCFQWIEVKSVINYSLNLAGFNIFNYFGRNADSLLIGKFLGAQALGYYSIAYNLMLYPLRNISYMVERVMFPVFSRFQDSKDLLKNTVREMGSTIALITFPMMLGMMTVCDLFVLTLYGSNWSPVIVLLLILAPIGMIQSITSPLGSIYMAKGRTDLFFIWGSFSAVFVIIAVTVGITGGINGVALAYAIAIIILTFPNLIIPFRFIDLNVKIFIKDLIRPFLSSIIMVMILMILKMILTIYLSMEITLLILVVCGVIVYFFISLVMNRNSLFQTINRLLVKGK